MAQQRTLAYDTLRALACSAVVALHAMAVLWLWTPDFVTRGVNGHLINSLQFVLFAANGLFFVLAGRLNIRSTADATQLKIYYVKKFCAIVLPVIAATVIHTLLLVASGTIVLEPGVGVFIASVLRYLLFQNAETEYWFLYQLIPLLLAAPFIGLMVRSLSLTHKTWLLILGFGWQTLSIIALTIGHPIKYGWPFGSWAFYFIAGAILDDVITSQRQRHALYVGAFLSFAATVVMVGLGYRKGMFDESPFMICLVFALYCGVSQWHTQRNISKLPVLIALLARYSFGIYLFHFPLMYFLLQAAQSSITIPGSWSWLIYPVFAAVLLALALGAGVLFDILVQKPIAYMQKRILVRISKEA